MADFKQIDYQGPNRVYNPHLGEMKGTDDFVPVSTSYGAGYADLDYLLQLLNDLIDNTSKTYSNCENILDEFALSIPSTNTDLLTAQNMAYPSTSAPGVITFDEYKYLLTNNINNATQYVLSAYEDSVRGPSGTNALDISTLALVINNEAKRIKEFIDGYIGDLDDTSEYRTIELFQDWAEDATNVLKGLWTALNGSVGAGLPESELAQVTSETAPKLQAVFQVKFNVINGQVRDGFSKLMKNWETSSSVFYAKNLGPALQFQLKIRRGLVANVKDMPILSSEVDNAVGGLDNNFTNTLADQLKRNNLFSNYVKEIILNVAQRDIYCRYMQQLAQSGTSLKTIFTSAGTIDQVDAVTTIAHPLTIVNTGNNYVANFLPSHAELVDREEPDAHPQYLLRSGGINSKIFGDVFLEDGVLFDGMSPKGHRHTGNDGTEKISGGDIVAGSITDENIDTTSSTPIPFNLEVINQIPLTTPSGVATVNVQVGFEIAEANVSGYEFEIIELG